MKKGKFLLTIAAAVLSLSGGVAGAADAEETYQTLGTGNKSCADFLQWHSEDDSQYDLAQAWASGYISATSAHVETQKSVAAPDDFSVHTIMRLVREVCRKDPDSELQFAVYVVSNWMLDKAIRR